MLNFRRRKPKSFWSNIKKKAKRHCHQKRSKTLAQRKAIKIRVARTSSTEVDARDDMEHSTCEVAMSEDELLGITADIIAEAKCGREGWWLKWWNCLSLCTWPCFSWPRCLLKHNTGGMSNRENITRTSEDEEIIVATKINLRVTTNGSSINSGVRNHAVSIISKNITEYPNKMN